MPMQSESEYPVQPSKGVSIRERLDQLGETLAWLHTRLQALQETLETGLIREPCREEALPFWRRCGRWLLARLGWRLPPATRRRRARPDEVAAARSELTRAGRYAQKLGEVQSKIRALPTVADASLLLA